MELCKYYSLYDAYDNNMIIRKLKRLKNEGKIEFEVEESEELIKIKDIDLDEEEIEQLLTFFEDNDVIPYLERDDDDDEDFFGDDYFDDEDE